MPTLADCTLITNSEYMSLVNPMFIGQTRVLGDGAYYMVWLSNGLYYKTKNIL
jgi:hypothetical protein